MNNSEIFISETITSVLNQTYKNWELLLVDDGSTDKTNEIAESFTARYSNIMLFKNEVNSGAAITRNHGTQKAMGTFIAFLDADDVWKPEKLEKQVEFMKNHDIETAMVSISTPGI